MDNVEAGKIRAEQAPQNRNEVDQRPAGEGHAY
jgi:hypothetical protein